MLRGQAPLTPSLPSFSIRDETKGLGSPCSASILSILSILSTISNISSTSQHQLSTTSASPASLIRALGALASSGWLLRLSPSELPICLPVFPVFPVFLVLRPRPPVRRPLASPWFVALVRRRVPPSPALRAAACRFRDPSLCSRSSSGKHLHTTPSRGNGFLPSHRMKGVPVQAPLVPYPERRALLRRVRSSPGRSRSLPVAPVAPPSRSLTAQSP